MDLATHNAWRDFKLATAVLANPALAWDEEPFALKGTQMQEAAGVALFYHLIGVIEAALPLVMPADEPSRTGSVADRLRWMAGQVPEDDRGAVEALAATYDTLHYRKLELKELDFSGVEDAAERAQLVADMQMSRTTGMGRPRFMIVHARRMLPAAVAAIERQLVAWGLVESPPAYEISHERVRQYTDAAAPFGPKQLGIMTHLRSGDEYHDRSWFTPARIAQDAVPVDWPALLGNVEATALSRENFAKGATNRAEQALGGDAASRWIVGEVGKGLAMVAAERAAAEDVAVRAEGEFASRAGAVAERFRLTEAALLTLQTRLAALPAE